MDAGIQQQAIHFGHPRNSPCSATGYSFSFVHLCSCYGVIVPQNLEMERSYWLREPRVYAASRILLADEVNRLLLSALLLAAEVNHLLLKPIGKQDYSP